jgi:xylulokinase
VRHPARETLIGVDLGTSAVKALVVAPDLTVLGSAWRSLPLITLSDGEIEQDPRLWWSAACAAVREALAHSGAAPESVRGLSVAAQGITFVPVDEYSQPLRNAISWMDSRPRAQERALRERFGEKTLFEITGKRSLPYFVLPKLLWLRENEPEIFARTRRILMPMDYLVARMTGRYVTDQTMASGTMLHDLAACTWSAMLLEACELDPGLLPEIAAAGTPAGRLTTGAAEELGLPPSVMVAVGGQDQKAAALGAGIGMDGTTVSLGTAFAVTQKGPRPMVDPRKRLHCYSDLMEGRWVIEGAGDCCVILDWLRQSFMPWAGFEDMDRMAGAEGPVPNPVLFLPFFSGAASPHFAPGVRGSLHGLGISTTPGLVVRAIYEGVAFLVRDNIAVIEELSRPVTELRVFGGGSRSPGWCQLMADVNGTPVSVMETAEAAAVGAAMLAGAGCGVFPRLEDSFPLLSAARIFPPQPERMKAYDEAYREYARTRNVLLAEAQGG